MADLEEIMETPRTGIDKALSNKESDLGTLKRERSKERPVSSGSQGSARNSPSGRVLADGRKEEDSEEKSVRQQADSPKQDARPTQEDHRARFYDEYHKVAEEYDKEFLKKHDEDLNTTLIFAGLFSAVTSAFIIEVDSHLQSDPNDETAALLRVLIYKIDNTTFGNDVPALPQWNGPPHAIVQVQAVLFASLTISLLSAFLAMLGKQWLNRYKSVDRRGSVAERSLDRQRKLDGIVVWYFDTVMESLPLMLQAGLLLLGCALSRYLWEVNIIVASVILSVTSLGAIFYFFIIVAGTASESCPYQTPGAHILRHILHSLHYRLLPTIYSTYAAIPIFVSSNLSRIYEASWCCRLLPETFGEMRPPWYSWNNGYTLLGVFALLPIVPVIDAYKLGRVILRSLVAFSRTVSYKLMAAYSKFINTRKLDLSYKTNVVDLQCISWILRTSLDKVVLLSTFEYLTSMPQLASFYSTLVLYCFKVFSECISISKGKIVVIQGSEDLATASADGFFRTLHHLATMDPTSRALADIQRRYNEVVPSELDFTGLKFYSTMARIHALAGRFGNPRDIRWPNPNPYYRPPFQEHVSLARSMAAEAQEKYQQTQNAKVPRSILRSALYFLSLCPLSPTSVVANCLTIVAIDLGCDVSKIELLDESARVESVSTLISQKLKAMIKFANSNLIFSKRKAINTLFPYAIYLEQGGQREMIDLILGAARVTDSDTLHPGKFMWHHVILYISRLFEQQSPTSLNRVIALISPHVSWEGGPRGVVAVARWAAAAEAIPYTEEVGSSVVDALLQIARINFRQSRIPIYMWEWLKRKPSLPPMCGGLSAPYPEQIVPYVRGLGDIDIIRSYFLLRWTGQAPLNTDETYQMERSIREDFVGIGMKQYRKDLMEQLDRAIRPWDSRLTSNPNDVNTKTALKQYIQLKTALLEVEETG